ANAADIAPVRSAGEPDSLEVVAAFEQRERVGAGGMRAVALDHLARLGAHLRRLRQRDAVDGRDDHRGRQRREREVGGGEALAAEVRPPVLEQRGREVELAPDGARVLALDAGPDRERTPDEELHRRPSVTNDARLPRRDALVVEAQREPTVAQHVYVHQPPRRGAEDRVEATTEPIDLDASALLS